MRCLALLPPGLPAHAEHLEIVDEKGRLRIELGLGADLIEAVFPSLAEGLGYHLLHLRKGLHFVFGPQRGLVVCVFYSQASDMTCALQAQGQRFLLQ